MTTSEIHDLLHAWAAAEASGDTAAMSSLITDDFSAIGPLGFTLDRDAWLTRFDHGLAYTSVSFDDGSQIRVEGDTAIVTVRQNTVGTYRGNPVPEAVRATAVLSRAGGHWCGPDAAFITGATLPVDGGLLAGMAPYPTARS